MPRGTRLRFCCFRCSHFPLVASWAARGPESLSCPPSVHTLYFFRALDSASRSSPACSRIGPTRALALCATEEDNKRNVNLIPPGVEISNHRQLGRWTHQSSHHTAVVVVRNIVVVLQQCDSWDLPLFVLTLCSPGCRSPRHSQRSPQR